MSKLGEVVGWPDPDKILVPVDYDGSVKVLQQVFRERRRQIEVEGWTVEHDDQHTDGSLAAVAACYAHPDPELIRGSIPREWPRSWKHRWWKPKDRRRDLERAAALIIAELERLDRAEGTA